MNEVEFEVEVSLPEVVVNTGVTEEEFKGLLVVAVTSKVVGVVAVNSIVVCDSVVSLGFVTLDIGVIVVGKFVELVEDVELESIVVLIGVVEVELLLGSSVESLNEIVRIGN